MSNSTFHKTLTNSLHEKLFESVALVLALLAQAMSDRLNSLLACPLFLLPETVTWWPRELWISKFMISGFIHLHSTLINFEVHPVHDDDMISGSSLRFLSFWCCWMAAADSEIVVASEASSSTSWSEVSIPWHLRGMLLWNVTVALCIAAGRHLCGQSTSEHDRKYEKICKDNKWYDKNWIELMRIDRTGYDKTCVPIRNTWKIMLKNHENIWAILWTLLDHFTNVSTSHFIKKNPPKWFYKNISGVIWSNPLCGCVGLEAPALHGNLTLEERCQLALEGHIMADLWHLVASVKAKEMGLPRHKLVMAPQTRANLQGVAQGILSIAASKEASWDPWRDSHGLSEVKIEHRFGQLRSQFAGGEMSARGFFTASARLMRQMGQSSGKRREDSLHISWFINMLVPVSV